jgi:hypothetical protein
MAHCWCGGNAEDKPWQGLEPGRSCYFKPIKLLAKLSQ